MIKWLCAAVLLLASGLGGAAAWCCGAQLCMPLLLPFTALAASPVELKKRTIHLSEQCWLGVYGSVNLATASRPAACLITCTHHLGLKKNLYILHRRYGIILAIKKG